MLSNSRLIRAIGLTAATTLLAATPATAQTINGLTFSIAGNGTTGGAFATNGTGTALLGDVVVAGANGTITRAMSEFNVAGLPTTSQATLSFRVVSATNPTGAPTSFNFLLDTYQGNNAANLSDYSISEFIPIGPYQTGNTLPVGSVVSFDVTNIFNLFRTNLGNAGTSLGVQLSPLSAPAGTVYTLDNFQLTLGSTQSAVPEPTTLALAGTGLLALGATMRRRRKA